MDSARLFVLPRQGRDRGLLRACGWSPDSVGEPPSCWRGAATDWDKLAVALGTLRRYGIAAAASQLGSPEQIADRLIRQVRSRFPFADGACVFWTADEEARCLLASGYLREPLTVHVYGPDTAGAAAAALERVGLAVGLDASPGAVPVGGAAGSPPG